MQTAYQYGVLGLFAVEIEFFVPHCVTKAIRVSLVAGTQVLVFQSPHQQHLNIVVRIASGGEQIGSPVQIFP